MEARAPRVMLASLALAAALASSCSGPPGCDFRQGSLEGARPKCQEPLGLVSLGPAYQGTCEALGALYLPDGCPREGVVGGCRESEGGGAAGGIDWYYEGTVDEVKAECERSGAAFVAP